MKKLLAIAVLVCVCVCGCERVDKDGAVKVVAEPVMLVAPSECSVEVFCRDDIDPLPKVAQLLKAGKRHAGVLTPNGLNCYHTLWCK